MTKIIAMFLAVFIVLGIMLYFIVISLRIVIESVNKKVNAYFLSKLQDFDQVFNDKIREIEKTEEYRDTISREIHSLELERHTLQTSRFYAPRPLIRDVSIPMARYIDNDFFVDYKKAKRLLEMDKQQIVKDVMARYPYKGNAKRYMAANSIKEKLNFEAVYDLCTLYQTEQLEFLLEVFTEEEKVLLEEYTSLVNLGGTQGERNFNLLHFLNWIEQTINEESPILTAYVGEEDEDFSQMNENVVCKYDANICEGVKIIYQNMLYNFSIYEARKKNDKIY